MNIRKLATAALLVVASFTTAFTAGTVAHQAPAFYGITPAQLSRAATALEAPGRTLESRVTGTPAQEWAACSAVYHYRHVNATDYGGVDATEAARAWYHAAHLAMYADPAMRADIRRYLFTGTGWSLVRYDCSPDQGL